MSIVPKITINTEKCGFLRRKLNLSNSDLKNVKKIVRRMNSETTSTEGKYVTTVRYVSGVDNGHMKFCSFPSSKNAVIKFENIEANIDKKTGKIIDYVKPLFMSWKKIKKQISVNLEDIIANYNNSNKVEKSTFGVFEYTEKGIDMLSV